MSVWTRYFGFGREPLRPAGVCSRMALLRILLSSEVLMVICRASSISNASSGSFVTFEPVIEEVIMTGA